MNPLMVSMLRRQTHMTSMTAMRGGGGGWHRPDPVPYKRYNYTRRYHLEDINTTLYSDVAPEFYLHLHSIHMKGSKETWFFMWCYFFCILCPMWALGIYCHK